MGKQTNLRLLRHRHSILLTELQRMSGLTNQYISRAELGQIPATSRLEEQLNAAMQAVIAARKMAVLSLEAEYLVRKGRLLELAEEGTHGP